jgi:2-methylcitrate dehydratase PrpD
MALAARVDCRHDPEITAKGKPFRHLQRIELYLKNGKRIDRIAEAPRGSEKNFASEEEIVAKFRNLASRVLPRPQVDELTEAVLNLEKLPNAARLAELMSAA